MAIRGGSAGGYTTLCALVFHDVFKAGASYFGVGDLEALARETHKFESRYLDRLVAPYPDGEAVYRERSPLANIVSSLDVLYSMVPEDDKETVESILKIAENSTDRIQRLVSSLLDVSRLESGQPVADQKVVDTMELIRSAVRDVTPVAGGRHQVLLTDLPIELLPVWVDEDMARRVLINLMENASKFSPAGGRTALTMMAIAFGGLVRVPTTRVSTWNRSPSGSARRARNSMEG